MKKPGYKWWNSDRDNPEVPNESSRVRGDEMVNISRLSVGEEFAWLRRRRKSRLKAK